MVSCCSYLSGYIKLVNWRVFVGKRILMRVLWFLKKKKSFPYVLLSSGVMTFSRLLTQPGRAKKVDEIR